MPGTILIVDDEQDIVEMIGYNLAKEGYGVLSAHDGNDALCQASRIPDLILLDILLPGLDGFGVLRELKRNPATGRIPVIFLTAKSSEAYEVLGLELGAADYLMKPISIPKLIARMKRALRTPDGQSEAPTKTYQIGSIELSPARHVVEVNGTEVFFPKKEFQILSYLMTHSDQVVNREALLGEVWGSDVLVVSRSVDVHIRRIRARLGSCAGYIETVTGVGYRMRRPGN